MEPIQGYTYSSIQKISMAMCSTKDLSSRGGKMGKPSMPYGLPDFGKWAAISKYVKYISVQITVPELRCTVIKILPAYELFGYEFQ